MLIASNSRLTAEGVRLMVLGSFKQASVVAVDSIDNLLEELNASKKGCLDIILIDDAISQFIGPQRLQKLVSGVKVCLINVKKDHRENAKSVRDGFHSLVLSSAGQSDLDTAIRALMCGESHFPYEIDVHKTPIGKVVAAVAPNKRVTYRQQEIVSLMSLGLSNKEIASHLDLSESTVKRHLSNVFKVLNVTNRVEAVRVASQRGLLNN